MTETDAVAKPLEMPVKFLPYLEKYRIYKLFKDMARDLVLALPRDHLKHMKVYFGRRVSSSKDTHRVVLLVSPELQIDIHRLTKEMIKDNGFFVITRRCVMDKYEKHDDYVPGCVSPVLMAEVTKRMTMKEAVLNDGWLMFDHPCTLREARCLQQEGVLPTVTLAIIPTPPVAPPANNPLTPARNFFDQDFEGLKYAYRASLKEVHISPEDSAEILSNKCFNAIQACAAGAQGAGQGLHAGGAPGVYRVLLIGPRGCGRRTQASLLSKHFNLVYLNFEDIYAEACEREDEIGKRLRKHGPTTQMKAEIVSRRLLMKDCIDHGWVLTGFPTSGSELELLDNMETPPNRIVILNATWDTCKERVLSRGVDWCTGRTAPLGAGPRVLPHPHNNADALEQETCPCMVKQFKQSAADRDRVVKSTSISRRQMAVATQCKYIKLDFYFSEALAELRAGAGITAWEVEASDSIDYVQTKIQAAVIASPAFNIECTGCIKNAKVD